MASTSSKPPIDREAQYRQIVRYTTLAGLVLGPVVLFMPPRKLDFLTVSLIVGTGYCANEVTREYTSRSILDRITQPSLPGSSLPSDRAREVQQLLKEEKERKRIREELQSVMPGKVVQEGEISKALRENAEAEKRDVIQKIWYGNEGSDWKAKRDQREREALQAGKGYGDLIWEQIWEVVNWGETKVDKAKKEDEKGLEEKIKNNSKNGKD